MYSFTRHFILKGLPRNLCTLPDLLPDIYVPFMLPEGYVHSHITRVQRYIVCMLTKHDLLLFQLT